MVFTEEQQNISAAQLWYYVSLSLAKYVEFKNMTFTPNLPLMRSFARVVRSCREEAFYRHGTELLVLAFSHSTESPSPEVISFVPACGKVIHVVTFQGHRFER